MKKKIDDIFRDRFHNLETPPPLESWENIADALPQKNKRKILPIWYQLAGTAASLVLFLSLYNILSPQDSNSDAQIVSFETKKKELFVDPVSRDFQETMKYATALLESLKVENYKKLIENRKINNPGIPIRHSDLAGNPEGEAGNSQPLPPGATPKSNNSQLAEVGDIKDRESIDAINEKNSGDENTINSIEAIVQADSQREKDLDRPIAENSKSKRLSIRPTAGAVYFDNLGNGNSLDERFASNKSSGEITMAYGVNLAYRINSKWNIRTGVNKINLSHNTRNIEFGTATLSASLNPQDILTPLLASSDSRDGYLNQSLGYIEIPLEFELSLLDKKIGLNIIGGASTFFLDDNMISHNSPMARTELGEANNLNDLSFSANLGLGFNYKFSQHFQLDLEPILKYQINTYNTGSGLTPYIFGIYTGLTYKF